MENSSPAYTVHFDSEWRVLLITMGKIATEASMLDAYAAIERFASTENISCGIMDLSVVETFNVSTGFIHRLAQRPPAVPVGLPRVVVAPRPDIYGMSRMFQMLRNYMDGELHVVRTLSEACALLHIDSHNLIAWQSSVPL